LFLWSAGKFNLQACPLKLGNRSVFLYLNWLFSLQNKFLSTFFEEPIYNFPSFREKLKYPTNKIINYSCFLLRVSRWTWIFSTAFGKTVNAGENAYNFTRETHTEKLFLIETIVCNLFLDPLWRPRLISCVNLSFTLSSIYTHTYFIVDW